MKKTFSVDSGFHRHAYTCAHSHTPATHTYIMSTTITWGSACSLYCVWMQKLHFLSGGELSIHHELEGQTPAKRRLTAWWPCGPGAGRRGFLGSQQGGRKACTCQGSKITNTQQTQKKGKGFYCQCL